MFAERKCRYSERDTISWWEYIFDADINSYTRTTDDPVSSQMADINAQYTYAKLQSNIAQTALEIFKSH